MSDKISNEKLDAVLTDFFCGDDQMLEEWINTAIPILEGKQPKELFNTFEGRNRIIQILGELERGETA